MKNKIKAVGFDFDGTLIMSEEQKAKAMKDIFRESFNIKKDVTKAYQKVSLLGLNREKKINLIFQQVFQRQPTKKEFTSINNQFSQRYQQSMNTCPLFQCSNMIKELRRQVKFIFLLSLENTREVKAIASHCGVARYFDEIIGGPKSKVENLQHILGKHNLKSAEMIYIGDSHSDVIASRKMNIKVVLLGKKHTYEKLKEDLEADFRFSSLCDLPKGLFSSEKKRLS